MKLASATIAIAVGLMGCATTPDADTPSSGVGATTSSPAVAESEDSRAFMAKNRLKPGVFETPTGLQYEIVRRGEGVRPTLNDVTHLFYSGRVLGSEVIIDKNRNVDAPDPVRFGGTIAGWQEALLLMPEGSTYIFYIPPNLAYGDRGSGPVGPDKVLIYRIELAKIQKVATSGH